jgi:hypothetical protein
LFPAAGHRSSRRLYVRFQAKQSNAGIPASSYGPWFTIRKQSAAGTEPLPFFRLKHKAGMTGTTRCRRLKVKRSLRTYQPISFE